MRKVKNLFKLNKELITLFRGVQFRFEVTAPMGPAYDTQIWMIPVPNDKGIRNYISLHIDWASNRMDIIPRVKGHLRTPKSFSPIVSRIDENYFVSMDKFFYWIETVLMATPGLETSLTTIEE
jgi:hypothetical protein